MSIGSHNSLVRVTSLLIFQPKLAMHSWKLPSCKQQLVIAGFWCQTFFKKKIISFSKSYKIQWKINNVKRRAHCPCAETTGARNEG